MRLLTAAGLCMALFFLGNANAWGQGKYRAVVVGVAEYSHGYSSLLYTARDARQIGAALEDIGYSVSLLASDADAGDVKFDNVRTALTQVAEKSQPGDTVLFFFAGHGSRRMGRDFLLMSDSDPDKPDATAVALDALFEIVGGSKATQRIFIMDACRNTNQPLGRPGTANGKPGTDFNDDLGHRIQRAAGNPLSKTAVLYACSPGETSKESVEERSGIFTHRFVQALRQANSGKILTLGAVLGYIRAHMPATLEQTPLLIGSPDLPLGLVRHSSAPVVSDAELRPPSSPLAGPGRYDAGADFGAAGNGTGAWSYGWLAPGNTPVSTTFQRFQKHLGSSTGMVGWQKPEVNVPTVQMNQGPNVARYGRTIVWTPGKMSQHPGLQGEYCTVRWTAPEAGVFNISALFAGLDTGGPTTTDVHVLLNGVPVFNAAINSAGPASVRRYADSYILRAGSTVDFVVGWGANHTGFSDTTEFSATIIRRRADTRANAK